MVGLDDYPWSENDDSRGDAIADITGSILALTDIFNSCNDLCEKTFRDLVASNCCSGNYGLPKGHPDCCED